MVVFELCTLSPDPELLTLGQNHVEMLIESEESAHQHPRISQRDAHTVIDPLEELTLLRCHI
jgi:hypothetical protein